MRITAPRRKSVALLGAFLALGLATWTFLAAEGKMTSNSRAESIFQSTKTVCIGRFLIDVPSTATIVYGPARVPVELLRFPNDARKFDDYIRSAINKSEEDKWLARDELAGSRSMLGQVLDGVSLNHKIVFGVGRGSGSMYNVQSFIRVGDDLFVQEFEEFAEDGRYMKAVREAREIAARIIPRAELAAPREPGICVDGAFIREPESYMVESVSVGFRLSEYQGVHISVETTKKSDHIASDAIEPRLKEAERAAVADGKGSLFQRIRFLRKGQRKVGSWNGFEVAARMPQHGSFEEVHEFAYLSHGEPKNPMLPVLDVKLHSGVLDNQIGRMKPTVSDDEALYIWDKLIGSIRPRSPQEAIEE